VRRVVTLLLCRRRRCLQVAANLDVVADRALIKQAFDSIEFRGQANMAHGLDARHAARAAEHGLLHLCIQRVARAAGPHRRRGNRADAVDVLARATTA
jgi:hypothetical protein